MDAILTDGNKQKAVDSSEENGLGEDEKKDRREAEPGASAYHGFIQQWRQLSTIAQRSSLYGTKSKVLPLQGKFRIETTTFKYLNMTTYCKCVVVHGFTQIISFVHIAAQEDGIGLIFQGKRLKHKYNCKITRLESVIVRKVTYGFLIQIQYSFHLIKVISHHPVTKTKAHYLHTKQLRKG